MKGVAAALVTRGDVDLGPSLHEIREAGITEIHVYDNSCAYDWKVFGRFAAALRATDAELIYTQDDDAMCPVSGILASWEEDDSLIVNVPEDEDWPWLAWGAVFRRDAIRPAFRRYANAYAGTGVVLEDMRRWPDVIFAELTPHRRIHLGHENCSWAYADNRMYREPDHYTTQQEVRDRCRKLVSR